MQPSRRRSPTRLSFSLTNARTALVLGGTVLLLLLHFWRRESPYSRRLKMLAHQEHRRRLGRAAEDASTSKNMTDVSWTNQKLEGAQRRQKVTSSRVSPVTGTVETGVIAAGDEVGKKELNQDHAKSSRTSVNLSPPSSPSSSPSPFSVSPSPLAVPTLRLSNNVVMPRLGLGTAGLGRRTEDAVLWAIEEGYRLIDSAQAREWYREDLVGQAVRRANVSREKLFLVSKLHPRHMGYRITLERFEDSLRDLGVQYVDLFLLHYPWCFPAICGNAQPQGAWHDSWRAFEEIFKRGKARAIGVSNFGEAELKELLLQAEIKPHVVQRNSDPLRADMSMQTLCRENKIAYMAYSSLGTQWMFQEGGSQANPVLSNPTIVELAQLRGCSPVQVVLRWGLEKGQIVIPRSGNRAHLRENLHAPSCPLTPEDFLAIDKLDGTHA